MSPSGSLPESLTVMTMLGALFAHFMNSQQFRIRLRVRRRVGISNRVSTVQFIVFTMHSAIFMECAKQSIK